MCNNCLVRLQEYKRALVIVEDVYRNPVTLILSQINDSINDTFIHGKKKNDLRAKSVTCGKLLVVFAILIKNNSERGAIMLL